jgi:thiosulfate reductase cytochrome b subunit
VAGARFDTTGLLGASKNAEGQIVAQTFPSWATLPGYHDLGAGRRWHFFFAWLFGLNGVLYLLSGILGGRVFRELIPSGSQLRHIGGAIWDHMRLKFPHGAEARRYNVLQKLSYLVVIFVLLPLMVLTGLAMAPGVDAGFQWLSQVFGGRQTARSIHFLSASAQVAFFIVHIVMVVLAGPINEVRSMITGWYKIKEDAP